MKFQNAVQLSIANATLKLSMNKYHCVTLWMSKRQQPPFVHKSSTHISPDIMTKVVNNCRSVVTNSVGTENDSDDLTQKSKPFAVFSVNPPC